MARAVKSAAKLAAAAVACFGASMLAMYADSWWIPNPAATDLAALIFIPWALTFLWSLLALANLGACAWATARAALSRPVPDYQRIAVLEADIFGSARAAGTPAAGDDT
jgi:hypothetical protein